MNIHIFVQCLDRERGEGGGECISYTGECDEAR